MLAFPLLQITARACPPAMWFRVTVMGAPYTLLRVYTAAAAQGAWLSTMAKSFLAWFLRMPQWTPPATKP